MGAQRLSTTLTRALRRDPGRLSTLAADQAVDRRDALGALISLHDLHLAPLDRLGDTVWLQHHPDVVRMKRDLEADFLAHLRGLRDPSVHGRDAVDAMRRIATRDLVPEAYEWLAHEANLVELREFLAIEGGPDGGFDDLVAICQVGLSGIPKLVLGTNYWDEMGRGDPAGVHTELHRQLTQALDLPTVPLDDLLVEALERTALNGLLATNRALQPEMIGALGLLELQAGPRCRRVLTALRRLGAPTGAFPFYEEHASADPRHGKDWLERGVRTYVDATPERSDRVVHGALWRSDVNRRLFAAMHRRFARATSCVV